MDNASGDLSDKETLEGRNSNSEWLPTKCRITKPPPPKPATNPLQFVKVLPSTLFKKAKEQTNKVEEIKSHRHVVKEEAEEWQQNLDNWKSSRRKRQEHIIERVVEVKKLEQEGHDKSRRKSKTFSEMLEDRNKRGVRLNIPIYDDESNDLSDYGFGSSTSNANNIKDDNTDDSSIFLNTKDSGTESSDRDVASNSNQSQSADQLLISTSCLIDKDNNYYTQTENTQPAIYTNILNKENSQKCEISAKDEENKDESCTYKKIIENYRSKIFTNKNEGEATYNTISDKHAGFPGTKIEYCSNKHLFQVENDPYLELNTQKRLFEDFANSLSIKERLKSLEKCAELQVRYIDTNTQGYSVKSMIKNLTEQNNTDIKNNNLDDLKRSKTYKVKEDTELALLCVEDNSYNNTNEKVNRSASPEMDAFMNKLNMFNQDLDSFTTQNERPLSNLSGNTTVASPTELLGLSSDREDSGIHTADVSCSVSQADDSVEFNNILSTIPNCIEKLQKEREREFTQQVKYKLNSFKDRKNSPVQELEINLDVRKNMEDIKETTQQFLDNVKLQVSKEYSDKQNAQNHNVSFLGHNFPLHGTLVYESQDIKNQNTFLDENFFASTYLLAPPKTKQPPKEKPPPPPEKNEKIKETNVKRLNSTKRIKKENHIRRSSFLGLDEPTDNCIDFIINMPPDVLQRESQLEKSFFHKCLDTRETCSSEVESQDSGLECERGRLSSDTWCSSLCESNTPTHERQDSEQTCNSVNSEEEEVSKKEREIISLVEEEEEQSKDSTLHSNLTDGDLACCNVIYNSTENRSFIVPHLPKNNIKYRMLGMNPNSGVSIEQDVEQPENWNEDTIFKKSKDKVMYKKKYSLENICDNSNTFSRYCEDVNCRKSMPELPCELYNTGNYSKIQSMKQSAIQYYKLSSGMDTQYRKSMPDIQQEYLRSVDTPDMRNELQLSFEHRKSMPELQKPLFSAVLPQTSFNRQPTSPSRPLTSLIKEQQDRDKMAFSKTIIESHTHLQIEKPKIPILQPGLNSLSAVPKHRYTNDNWIQPKINGDKKPKNYNNHWLYQEAELRRIAEQRKYAQKGKLQPAMPEKHIHEHSAQMLSQRVQNLTSNVGSPHHTRSDNKLSQEIEHNNSYRSPPPTLGHASPISYLPLSTIGNSEGKILSISGKKKCSFCGNELGRGAAMIIESLCLFYHMDCFQCCVCHVQLGDGLMGTDVRVRNQKLHCHNCYTSDDGVKFSCV